MRTLNQYTLEELQEEIDKRKSQDTYDQAKTEAYLEERGILKHRGKGVTIWSDTLFILLEAIHGDRQAVEYHKVMDGIHFNGDNPVSLLDSATAEAKDVLKSLDEGQSHDLVSLMRNNETIHAVTLSDIGHIALNIESESNDDVDFSKDLTEEQVKNIINKILGEPIENVRSDIIPSFAHGLDKIITERIREVIQEEIAKK